MSDLHFCIVCVPNWVKISVIVLVLILVLLMKFNKGNDLKWTI